MLSLFKKVFLVCSIIGLLKLNNLALAQGTDHWPKIIADDAFNIELPFPFQITNDAEYFYLEGYESPSSIIQNGEVVAGFNSGPKAVAGWSPDGKSFAVSYGQDRTFNLASDSIVELFDVDTETLTLFHIPIVDVSEVSWSPFSSSILLLNGSVLYDLGTGEQTQVPILPLPDLSSIDYSLYQDYVWERATQFPIAHIQYSTVVEGYGTFGDIDEIPESGSYLTTAEFRLCTLNGETCRILLDNISDHRAVVFRWDTTTVTNKLIWGGYTVSPDEPVKLTATKEQILNGALYVTDLITGETDEFLEFSNFGENLVFDFSISPDGQSLLLQAELSRQEYMNRLLTLDWGVSPSSCQPTTPTQLPTQ